MPQVNSKAFKFAPAETSEKRIDLSLDGDETVIKLSSWIDGLGWCGEKTMRIDPELLDEMHRMIGAARIRVRQRRLDESDDGIADGKVLKFPAGA
jgi:hypothetical protein